MSKPIKPKPNAVREPAQVYLSADDSALLARLAQATALSKAEILRRGIRSFAREQTGDTSPMLAFLAEPNESLAFDGVAVRHDDVLAESYHTSAKQEIARPSAAKRSRVKRTPR